MTSSDRESLLDAFEGLRVADVRDGMDTVLLHHVGSMAPSITPLWRTRAHGIARTVKYVPFAGRIPELDPEAYWKWVGDYYRDVCPYPWTDDLEKGDFVVIDQSGVDVGLMGSENTLACLLKGVTGFVSDAGVRDTDEIIVQKVPFWSAFCSQGMVQGRLQYADHNCPVVVGGVTVNTGDIVVADGDGVIVVPQDRALDVARYADEEHRRDMKHRRQHYDALGWEADGTVGEG